MNESCFYEWVMSLMNESCPLWMSHVSMKESCPLWMSHVPYEWVMSRRNESCPLRVSHRCITSWRRRECVLCTPERCMSCVWIRHAPYANGYTGEHRTNVVESCLRWMSHVPGEWVMSQVNESCPRWMSHVPCLSVMSPVNVSSRMCRRHTPYANGCTGEHTASVNELCPRWMRHVPLEWVMPYCSLTHIHPLLGELTHIHPLHTYTPTFHLRAHRKCGWVVFFLSPHTCTHTPDRHIWTKILIWVTAHVNESCLTWMSHVPNEWVISPLSSHHTRWTHLSSSGSEFE